MVTFDITLVFYSELNDGSWKINMIISAHNINYKNYWCGEWLSWWELVKTSNSDYHLTGQVRANTYYYEEGNVQFNLKTDHSEQLKDYSSEQELVTDIVRKIEEFENRVNFPIKVDPN
jgi:hypothetical protein